ncbi:hypothetical protein ALCH109712_09215 [Alkalicoccus chagannorensis]
MLNMTDSNQKSRDLIQESMKQMRERQAKRYEKIEKMRRKREEMKTSRMSDIRFRPFQKKDQQRLIEWIESPAFLVQWGGPQFSYPLTEEQLDEYRESGEKANADRLIYSVLDAETDAVIGHISLGAIEKENGSARIGKVLVGDNAGRGRGIGTKMLREMLRIAFDELKLHRVGLGVYDFNTPAIACYEKAGFSRDGRLRDVRKVDGSYWSLIVMSILEHEWENFRGASRMTSPKENGGQPELARRVPRYGNKTSSNRERIEELKKKDEKNREELKELRKQREYHRDSFALIRHRYEEDKQLMRNLKKDCEE